MRAESARAGGRSTSCSRSSAIPQAPRSEEPASAGTSGGAGAAMSGTRKDPLAPRQRRPSSSSAPARPQHGPIDLCVWSILEPMVDNESSRPPENTESSPAAPKPEQSFRDVRHYVPQDILDVSFPVSLRGYDRDAVDAYVKRVNRVIAELKVSASPPAAVRHALDLAQEKVEALLQAAREAAEQITTSARQEADESTARARGRIAPSKRNKDY